MTLTTQDGKPYRTFSEPVRQLANQVLVEKRDLVFHNFGQAQVVTAPAPVYQPPQPVQEVPKIQSKEAVEFLEMLKKEAKNLKTEIPQAPVTESIANDNTVIVHCHPANAKEYKDDLYGDVKKTVRFGKKFTFEALLMDCSDIEISLFTKTKITIGSIVYPSKYKNGEDLAHFRWWRVKKTEVSEDGFILIGEVTEEQRDFSD
jgi:hypothetical protein